MTSELKELLNTISFLSIKKRLLIVAIDGRGGSGKSTLAKIIKENLEHIKIISIDDFYLPSVKRIFDQNLPIDVTRLEECVLKPLQEKKQAKYQRYESKTNSLAEEYIIDPQGTIIIEGWFSLHRTLFRYYDYKIWKEEDKEICLQRGIKRELTDRSISSQLTKTQLLERWGKYQQLEENYFATQNPKKLADTVIQEIR